MRRHLLFGVQGPNKGAAGPARSPIQPSSTVPWGATVRNIKSPKWIVSGLFLFEMRLAWHNIRGIISTSTNYFLAEKCALQRESK